MHPDRLHHRMHRLKKGNRVEGHRDTLFCAFKDGFREAQGDRLVDILGVIAYNIKALEKQPEMMIQAAYELLPGLVDIVGNPSTHAMLRATAAGVLATLGPALERAIGAVAQSNQTNVIPIDELRTNLLKGYRECLSRPTAAPGRMALAEAIRHVKPAQEARLLAWQMLTDPTPDIAAKALESLLCIEADTDGTP